MLLKNDGVLPLDKSERILVVGDLFDKMRYQGAGSSMINPTFLTTPKTAFDKQKVTYKHIANGIAHKTEILCIVQRKVFYRNPHAF